MTDVTFADNLMPTLGGCGQIAFARCGAWYFERHARDCKPGMWSVGVTAQGGGEFWPLIVQRADAVVDDFGTLRMVGEPS